MKLHSNIRSAIALIAIPTVALTATANAQVVTTFKGNAIGMPPSIGGLNEPTGLTMPPGSRVEIVGSDLGFDSEAVAISDGAVYADVSWATPPMLGGTLRTEATVSISEHMTSYFMQAVEGNAVIARILTTPAGALLAQGVQVGTYDANMPFRIRIDLTVDTGTYAVTLDPELDGFADNTPTTGLPFNTAAAAVTRVIACLNQSGVHIDGAAVAFDDVYVGPVSIGSPYCNPAVPNSTGQPARIHAIGSRYANQNMVALEAYDLPPNSFGYFLVSTTQSFVPNAGGSAGTLCLGGLVGRFAAQIENSGANGAIDARADLSNLPQLGIFFGGDTLNFQAWYRDFDGGSTSNFSNAVAIPFF